MVDKNSIFGGMITTQGAAKKTNCDALGIPWEPRYMLIGDANGTDPVPSPSQTKLVNQVYRAQINQLRVSPTDANVLIAEVVLPPDVGGWWVRELALEDKDGVFSAVANAPPSYKPVLAQGSGRNQVVRMHIITSGTSNIQLKIDPSVVLATRQYVDEAVNGLLPANKPAGTYTKVTVNDRGVFVSGSNPTTLAGYGITDTYTKDQITAMIAQASALPVGSMIGFPVDKVAPGFLELDGSVKSVATYPDLATFLGGAFNKGDEGAGNFRLPESRGEFLRGWDHGRGVDAGRGIGTWQKGSVHSFDIGPSYGVCGERSGVTPSTGENGRADLGYDATQAALYPSGAVAVGNAGSVNALADNSEITYGATRPRNLSVMWCIKAWNAPINQGNIDVAALAAEMHGFSAKLSQLFKTSTDVKAARAINIEYRNERDVPILVSIGLNSTAANQTAVLLVDGKTVLGSSYPTAGWSLALITVVPANGTYKIPTGSYTINTFVEFT
jgi:phage-related tail fiber protein